MVDPKEVAEVLMETGPTCKNCRWWRSQGLGAPLGGDCHRLPPPDRSDGYIGKTTWLITYENDWCGEFMTRPSGWEELIRGRK